MRATGFATVRPQRCPFPLGDNHTYAAALSP